MHDDDFEDEADFFDDWRGPGDDTSEFDDEPEDFEDAEPYENPVEADAEVLASAGWGTDEDYGYFGGDE